MYVLASVSNVCTDRDRDPLLMYELADFPRMNPNSTTSHLFLLFFFPISFFKNMFFRTDILVFESVPNWFSTDSDPWSLRYLNPIMYL